MTKLEKELQESFAACQTELERSMWRIYARKDLARIFKERQPTGREAKTMERLGVSLP